MQTHTFHVELTPHPDSPTPEALQITVEGERQTEALNLCYMLTGDCSGFAFPDTNHPAPPDRLWTRSCCELFWRERGAAAYREYNFSPSMQWAAYTFTAYRTREENILPSPPQRMNWTRDESRLFLQVEIAVSPNPLQLAFAVVLKRTSGESIYYALRHPPGSPDFHHPDNFALSSP
ncbi:MAG: hypothetical protein FWG81_00345 [Betaproteobacteria bacterium]|nr:hypothetical protein [Betaproteobacteria bacterium]